jgi:prepilin-type N-terminal cleavage/methylation domain-containing protein
MNERSTIANSRARCGHAFTLLELLVVIAIIGIMAALLFPVLGRAKERARRIQCMTNLKQVSVLVMLYAEGNNQKLPVVSAGRWAWDVEQSVADKMVEGGIPTKIFYCACTGFSDEDNVNLWNLFASTSGPPTSDNYRVLGYAMTFPGTVSLFATNQNTSLVQSSILDPDTGTSFAAPAASDRVLMADGILSQPTEADTSDRSQNTYSGIQGAYTKLHLSAHLQRSIPAGGNLGMLDGHAEWRKFDNMFPRTDASLTDTPVFWW